MTQPILTHRTAAPAGVRLKESVIQGEAGPPPACMKAMNTARADRLAAARELLESCHGSDGRPTVDLDTIAQITIQMILDVGQAPVERDMDPEEEAYFLGLAGLLVGVQDMLHLLAQKQKGGRYRQSLLDLRRAFWDLVIVPRFQMLPVDRQVQLFTRSHGWGYQLWEPGHRIRLIEILRRVATGKRSFTKEQMEEARLLMEHLDVDAPPTEGACRGQG